VLENFGFHIVDDVLQYEEPRKEKHCPGAKEHLLKVVFDVESQKNLSLIFPAEGSDLNFFLATWRDVRFHCVV
jgi:hypothetical protein